MMSFSALFFLLSLPLSSPWWPPRVATCEIASSTQFISRMGSFSYRRENCPCTCSHLGEWLDQNLDFLPSNPGCCLLPKAASQGLFPIRDVGSFLLASPGNGTQVRDSSCAEGVRWLGWESPVKDASPSGHWEHTHKGKSPGNIPQEARGIQVSWHIRQEAAQHVLCVVYVIEAVRWTEEGKLFPKKNATSHNDWATSFSDCKWLQT